MKRLYTLVIATLVITTNLVAQNLVYPQGQHVVATVLNENFEQWQIDVTTPTPEAITYKWTLISNSFPAWSYSLCDYTNCWVGVPPGSHLMTAITLTQAQNGIAGFFKLNLTTGPIYGAGVVKIYVYDALDINRGDTVSWTIDLPTPVGINEDVKAKTVSFYPNPAKNTVTFMNTSDQNNRIEILNALGETVLSQLALSNQRIILSVSKLNKGIYFVSFTGVNGIKQTERLFIQ